MMAVTLAIIDGVPKRYISSSNEKRPALTRRWMGKAEQVQRGTDHRCFEGAGSEDADGE